MATINNRQTDWTPKVGDRVMLNWGLGKVKGTITENRGPLAEGGQILWGVRAFVSPSNHFYTELSTAEMEPLPVVERAKRVLRRGKVAVRQV